MKDKIFIDTNILVYANDGSEKEKQGLCRKIILQGIKDKNIVFSVQVLGEFFVTVTRKIKHKLPEENAKKEILLFRAAEIVEMDYPSIIQAIRILKKYQLSYWDALIAASAIKSGCNKLYSEDLNHGQKIDHVEILNPFRI